MFLCYLAPVSFCMNYHYPWLNYFCMFPCYNNMMTTNTHSRFHQAFLNHLLVYYFLNNFDFCVNERERCSQSSQ